ncbi:SDR family oxidoreductase [Aureibacillus halotolerans]|uniref:3-oxoacyl-[acyl-carrier protein] reductase n=1 Tax=Aureibacillus halotolerans TaxID=1508390 RepID=A0A4R6U0H7_9BACI|nr:SDR family oxidoreductase [Aureibacillus halotolerans]TDQ39818.1 3-oxoacyl-[acyl-carrier protein] reductase [Aureibacillus halotolerans]
MTKLHGKTAIVTGTSRPGGIGAAVCRALAKEGANLFFTHLYHYDKAENLGNVDENWPDLFAEDLRSYGNKAAHMELDLTDPTSPSQLLEAVRSTLGLPTILVNNATYSVSADFRQLNASLIDAHCAVNIRGTFMLSAEFARMLEVEQSAMAGRIINLTSGQGKGPMPGNLAYAATKGAVSTFTECLAAELAPLKITVNAVDPGPTDSDWMSEEVKRALLPQFPMGRIGLPEDAARLIAFLATDDSQWITGQIIHSRGGY